jgi:hypothetical protein
MARPNNARAAMVLLTLGELLTLESCAPEMIASRLAQEEESEVTIAALPSGQEALAASTAGAEAAGNAAARLVLESGNYWSAGIPGFGENALSAFVGEYRIPGKTERVKVWLTMEFMYYEGWTNRDSVNGIAVIEKTADDGRIVAASLNEFWTAVLHLPPGAGLSEEDQNRIVSNLINNFDGFSGQSRNISLPALVDY